MTQTTMRPPPSRPPPAAAAVAPRPAKTFTRKGGIARTAHRLLIYGTGGIGKSSLSKDAPGALVCDLDRGTADFDVERVEGIETWADLRAWLASDGFEGVGSIVIDTVTAAEELCRRHVVENVTTDKGQRVQSIEGYGWGKGYVHMFEEWKKLLADLERHYTQGRNIVLVAHERTGKVPNPSGDDFIRYEPRLLSNNQVSLMNATKEWCDHVLFVSYDVTATGGKAKGSGTRTIYGVEQATHMAKSRTLGESTILYPKGSTELWDRLRVGDAADEAPPAE